MNRKFLNINKMKNIIILLSFLCIIFNACTDVLDISPDGNLSMEDVLKDPEKVEGLLNACYRDIPVKNQYYIFWEQLVVAASDDAWSPDDAGWIISELYNDQTSAAYHPMNNGYYNDHQPFAYWEKYWRQIRLCTEFIAYIGDAATKDEDARARMKAEAHVMRAFFYLELVKWFGKLPIIDDLMAIDADFSKCKRESVYTIAQYIAADCDVAINTPSLPWRITVQADAMRATKALAYAIKTKMMLFAASPLHNEGANHWEEAYQIGKEAVNALKNNGYALFTECTRPDYYQVVYNFENIGDAAAFKQTYCESIVYEDNPLDKETIYQHKSPGGHAANFNCGYIGSGFDGTVKAGAGATQELIDAYETINGKTILNLEKPYLDERHLVPNYNLDNEMYNPADPYKNRDPRMYATNLMNGSVIEFQDADVVIETFVGGVNGISSIRGDNAFTRTGYYPWKVIPPNACWLRLEQSFSPCWKHFRFSELLLDYAEAAAEAGHAADALAAANEVRARVKMPALPTSLSPNELVLRVRNERRVELAYNENRYFDMRRWQQPDGDMSELCKWLTAMRIEKQPDGSFTYTRENPYGPRGGWQNKDLLLPIPLAEASRMEQHTGEKWQNPGW